MMYIEFRGLEGDLSYDNSISLITDAINDIMDDMMCDDSREGKPHREIEFNSKNGARVFYYGYTKSKRVGTFKGPSYKSIKSSE